MGNMILIKDRHTNRNAIHENLGCGKYDTYKGSTPTSFDGFLHAMKIWEI